jgi:hypothetical protein
VPWFGWALTQRGEEIGWTVRVNPMSMSQFGSRWKWCFKRGVLGVVLAGARSPVPPRDDLQGGHVFPMT